MTLAKSITTGGMIVGSPSNPARVSALSIISLLPRTRLPAIAVADDPSSGSYLVVPRYDERVGVLSANPSQTAYGAINISVTPSFPDNFLGYFAVLRGRYGYKTSFEDDNVKIVHEEFGNPKDVVEIVDDEVEPLHTYYYSVIALCGTPDVDVHIEYNPTYGFDSSYSYKNYGHAGKMYSLLPDGYRQADFNYFQGEETETERLFKTLGFIFDAIKSDGDSIVLREIDVYNANLDQLRHTSKIMGWEPNTELSGELQRKELVEVVSAYKKKGRLSGVEDLIAVFSDYGLCYEYGRDRLIQANTRGTSVDYDNEIYLRDIDKPWYCSGVKALGNTDGTAFQQFVLPDNWAREVLVFVGGESWHVVDSFSGFSGQDNVVVLTEDADGVSTLTFGNGFAGSLPDSGEAVTAEYKLRGDISHRSVAPAPSWYNAVGVNVIIDLSAASTPVEQKYIEKIKYVFDKFKPSYSVLNFTLKFDAEAYEDVFALSVGEFEDEIISLNYLTMDTASNETDNEEYVIG